MLTSQNDGLRENEFEKCSDSLFKKRKLGESGNQQACCFIFKILPPI